MRNIVATLDKLPDQAQVALAIFLLKVVGPAIDSGKTHATVAAMQSHLKSPAPAVVTASGTNGSNADGITMWLKSKLSLTVNN